MGAQQNNQKTPANSKDAVNETEVRKESSKAAQSALELKKQAKEFRQAAAGAGDPEERQKLLELAIDKEIEAESFGKTARYLRSGTFQGLAAGTGIGVVPGATLGTLTGTLVGGVTSMITGGLGGAGGAVVGALHGPFWNMGEMAGKGIQKITGNLPGWKATPEQKKTLEKMMGQIHGEEMPDEGELDQLRKDGGATAEEAGSLMESVKSMMPSMPSWVKGKQEDDGSKADCEGKFATPEQKLAPGQSGQQAPRTTRSASKGNNEGPTVNSHSRPAVSRPSTQQQERKKPRKLEVRSEQSKGEPKAPTKGGEQRKPKKLELRSK